MNGSSCTSWQRAIVDLVIIAIAGLATFLPYLGQERDLASREWRHAEVAQEMLQSGDFLVPHLLGVPYPDKPPLTHAAIALAFDLGRHSSLALARLPSVIAAIVAAMAVYGIGITPFGRTVGLLAALGLMGVQGYSSMARTALPDMGLTMWVMLSCLAAIQATCSSGRRRLGYLALSGITCGLAILTKGPMGPAVAILGIALLPSGIANLRRMERWDWAVFLLITLATTAAWAAPVYLRDYGAYLHALLTQPDLGIHPDHKIRPFYYYVVPLAAGFLPLTLLLPVIVGDVRQRGWPPALKVATILFILLSILPKKRIHYALPIFPFLALVAATAIVRSQSRGVLRLSQALIALSLAAGPFYFVVIQPRISPPRSATVTFADSIRGLIEPGRTVVATDDIVEPLAFFGYRGRLIEAVEPDEAVADFCRGGIGSYFLLNSEASAQIRQRLPQLPAVRVLDGRLPAPINGRSWKVYRLWAACRSTGNW